LSEENSSDSPKERQEQDKRQESLLLHPHLSLISVDYIMLPFRTRLHHELVNTIVKAFPLLIKRKSGNKDKPEIQ